MALPPASGVSKRAGPAQGGAYQYFLQRDIEDLDALGVVIIEGEQPGSSYFAAELRIPVEEANEIAEENSWTIRFVREGAVCHHAERAIEGPAQPSGTHSSLRSRIRD